MSSGQQVNLLDLKRFILYLSAGASWMTGNTLAIDGGELIRIAGELPLEEG